jgi:hypothetical protein
VTVATVERGIARGRLLLDRDGGREAVDMLDVRLLHHLEELARVGREGFHVPPLALRIDGIEGERGFARTGEAGDDRQALARDIHVDGLQIVLPRAADGNMGQHRPVSVPFMF